MTLAEAWKATRRQTMLRLIDKVGGSANETVLCVALENAGFHRDPRSEFRDDLDYLVRQRCLTEEWNDDMRVVTLTERGGDAATGRIHVTGVAHDRT